MKTAQVYLYLESCIGRLQGGATLTTLDKDGDVINQSISSARNNICATYRSLVNRGAQGKVFTCYGTGGWITNVRFDRNN